MKRKVVLKRLATIICSVTIVFNSVNLPTWTIKAAENETVSIAILTTTDMHGKCWSSNVLNDTSVKNSMLRVSAVVKEARETYKDNVLLIDNGDTFQGTPVSSYNITNASSDFDGVTPMAIAMKYLNYDMISLGNHEFNYKWSTMQKIYDYLESDTDVNGDGKADSVEVVSANLVYKEADGTNEANSTVFTPYIIKEVAVGDKTAKIGVLGLENTDCTRWDIVDNYPNINFAHLENTSMDMVYEVNKYVPEMKKAGCDYIIVSYHSGLGSDSDSLTFGTNTENQALRVIANTTDVDMVICGHDHQSSYSNNSYKNKDGKDVIVVNAGGQNITETILSATEGSDGKITITSTKSENINLTKYSDDENLKALIKPYADSAESYVNKSCGKIADADWDTKTNYYLQQTDTMDFINRAQISSSETHLEEKYNTAEKKEALKTKYGYKDAADVCTVDLSASSVTVQNNSTVAAGNLSIKDIYKFYKYDNSLYILPLTGQQIKDCLEYVAENRIGYTIKNGEVKFSTINDAFTCPVFYGIDFSIDMSKPANERVTIKGFKNGKAFELERVYNLAINNYHLSNGPFAQYKPADTIWSQTDDLGGGTIQEMVAEYVAKAGETGVKPDRSNWSIEYSAEIPADEAAAIRKTEVYDPISDEVFDGKYRFALNLAQAAEKTDGRATVIGQVVYSYAGNSYCLEDVIDGKICGYLVYDFNNEDKYNVGDVVAVSGTMTVYNGVPEMKNVESVETIASLGADFIIQPQVVTVDELLNQTDDEYLNEYVVIQNVPASNSSVKDGDDSIIIYNGANLPDGLEAGTPCDIYAVCSTYSSYQLRTGSSDSYVAHIGTYDPVSNDMFTEGIINIKEAYAAESGSEVTVIAQVAAKFAGNPEGAKNNIILQDVINGEIVGINVYDSKPAYSWNVGDVVKVTGKIGAFGNVTQITPSAEPVRLKTAVSFQPQKVTVSELGSDYLSELVTIKNATVGAYNAKGNTPVKDATGTINIFKGEAYPSDVKEDSAVDIIAVCSAYNGTAQLRMCDSFDYISLSEISASDDACIRIPVMETSDVHGFLLDVSSAKEDTYQYRMAYIADKANDIRKEKGDVILLDGGDIFQGNPVSNLLEGKSLIEAYDVMKYDAVALGNHEFDWGINKLVDSDGTMGSYVSSENGKTVDSKVSVLCANMFLKSSSNQSAESVNFTKDYIIVEKTGKSLDGKTTKTYKIAVWGYVDDYSKDIMPDKIEAYSIDESKLADIIEQAKKLEESGKADATILLCHASAAGVAKKLGSDTAIDLVCGGHSHVDAAGTENGVTFIQPKNQAQSYAYAELCFAGNGEVTVENAATNSVTKDKTKLYDTKANTDELDSKIVNISKAAVEKVAPIMNEQIGLIDTAINKQPIGDSRNSSTAGTWICDAMNAATGADVSFTNNGGIRTEFAIDGETRMLSVGDIYTITPFGNTLPTFTVNYEKLKEIIEYAVGDAGKGLGLRMGGATAYYDADGKVTTLFVGKTLVYNDNTWVVSKDASVTISANEYVASSSPMFKEMTSNEVLSGKVPKVDNEAFIEVLKKEANANAGKLHVSKAATLVSGSWDGVTLPEVFENVNADVDKEDNNQSGTDQNNSETDIQKPAAKVYNIILGADASWTKGKDLIIASDADYSLLEGVKVDGVLITEDKYTSKAGSTIVTIKGSYLETLKAGKHEIEIVSKDGAAKTSLTIVENVPSTGDNDYALYVIALMLSASVVMAGECIRRKRKSL